MTPEDKKFATGAFFFGLGSLAFWLLKRRTPALGALQPAAEHLIKVMSKKNCGTCKPAGYLHAGNKQVESRTGNY